MTCEPFHCRITIAFTARGKNVLVLGLCYLQRVWDRAELDTAVSLTGVNGAMNGLAYPILRMERKKCMEASVSSLPGIGIALYARSMHGIKLLVKSVELALREPRNGEGQGK